MFTPSQLKGRTQDVQRTHKAVEKQKKNRNLQYVHKRRHFSWPVLAALCVHCQMRTNLFLSQRYWIHHHRHRMFQCLLTMFFVRIKHFRGMKDPELFRGRTFDGRSLTCLAVFGWWTVGTGEVLLTVAVDHIESRAAFFEVVIPN